MDRRLWDKEGTKRKLCEVTEQTGLSLIPKISILSTLVVQTWVVPAYSLKLENLVHHSLDFMHWNQDTMLQKERHHERILWWIELTQSVVRLRTKKRSNSVCRLWWVHWSVHMNGDLVCLSFTIFEAFKTPAIRWASLLQ